MNPRTNSGIVWNNFIDAKKEGAIEPIIIPGIERGNSTAMVDKFCGIILDL